MYSAGVFSVEVLLFKSEIHIVYFSVCMVGVTGVKCLVDNSSSSLVTDFYVIYVMKGLFDCGTYTGSGDFIEVYLVAFRLKVVVKY